MTGTRRLLVTASRDWDDPVLMWDVFTECHQWARDQDAVLILVHGDAAGGDQLAKLFGEITPGCEQEPHPADWEGPCRSQCQPGHRRKNKRGREYCPMAGLYRNEEEIAGNGGDRGAAFIKAKSSGATHAARLMEKAGIPTRRYEA